MSKLVHENVLQVMGACVDMPNICLLTEFCPRGSLQELLHQSDMELDAMFKMSLLVDVSRVSRLHFLLLPQLSPLTKTRD